MKIENLENGYVKLTPNAGKVIECLIDERHYAEVVCHENQIKYYVEKFAEQPNEV